MTRSLLKIVMLVLVCSLIGGAVVYKYRDQIRGVTRSARISGLLPLPAHSSGRSAKAAPAPERDQADKTEPAAETPAAAARASDSAEKKKRVQLEREVKRLRDQLTDTQRENAEMKLQLKLLKEGSRTGR